MLGEQVSLVLDCRQLAGPDGAPQRGHRGLGLFATDAGFEARNQRQPSRAAIVQIVPSRRDQRLGHHGHEQLWGVACDGTVKVGGSDPDNREGMPVDIEHLVDNAGIGTEMCVPIVEAQHCHGIAVLDCIIGRHKQTPKGGFHSQHVEVIAGNQFSRCQVRLVLPLHPNPDLNVGQHAREYLVLVAQVTIHGIGEIGVRVSAEGANAPRV